MNSRLKCPLIFITAVVMAAAWNIPTLSDTPSIAANRSSIAQAAGQQIQFFITGQDVIVGEDLNIQINDGTFGPLITGVEILSGTLFAGNNTGANGGIFTSSNPAFSQYSGRLAIISTTTQSGSVSDTGLLVKLTLDAGAVALNSPFQINLINTLNGPSDLQPLGPQMNLTSDNYPNTRFSVGAPQRQWISATGGTWVQDANWSQFAPYTSGDQANFLSSIGSNAQITLDGNRKVGSLTFNNAAHTYTLAPGTGGTLTLDSGLDTPAITNSGGSHTINVPLLLTANTTITANANTSLVVSGSINGNFSLQLSGTGIVIFTGANAYGTTTISSSTLQVGNGGATGSLGTGPIINNGTFVLNRSNALTLSNAINGAGTVIHAGPGTTTLANYQGTGPLALSAGKLVLSGSAQPPVRTTALTIAGTATAPTAALDLKDGGLIVTYAGNDTTEKSTMYSQIIAGKGGLDGSALFTYAGNGITSSTARTSNVAKGLNLFAVGVLNNADLTAYGVNPQYSATKPFMGQTVTPTTILARYTYAGDINLDGKINIDDYNYIDTAFASPAAYPGGWIAGDFNKDGKINIDDYNVIDTAFAFQGAPLGDGLTALGDTSLVSLAAPSSSSAPVPEPASLILLATGGAGLLVRRRHRQKWFR